MTNSRRKFIRNAALAGAAVSVAPKLSKAQSTIQVDDFSAPNYDTESGLKITRIESFTKDYATLVRITADDGSQGIGQLAPYNNDITSTVLHQMIVQHVLGKDPYQMTSIANYGIEINYKYPWSFVSRAMSGIETALWDLKGKRENKSVCELLGGSPKPIPAYGSSMSRDIQPKDEAARMVKLRDEQGFEAFKVRVGKVVGHNEDHWPGRSEEIIPLMREVLGDKTMIQADANSCYTADKAIEIGKMMQDQGYYFFEEPCPFWELEWTAKVNNALSMKVAGGEQDNDLAQWKRMINMNAVDITQPDLCYLGGVSRTMHVAAMAHQAGKMCVPHSANLSLITIFAMHLLAAIPNPAPHLEYSIEDVDWVKGIFDHDLTVKDGNVAFPKGPGWGVEFNEDWLARAEHQISEK